MMYSTGQLHKGVTGRGLFIHFIADPVRDIAMPDEASADASSVTFGVL